MMMHKAFITGCDESQEWMLPWFVRNYQENRNKLPLIFADFGVSKDCLEWCKQHFDGIEDVTLGRQWHINAWFLKPQAILSARSEQKVWLDADCEIDDNIEDIFNHLVPNKLNMVEDRPWTKRTGEKWHNSGVVGVIDKPDVLTDWYLWCVRNMTFEPIYRGDQEVLHAMIEGGTPGIREKYINDLPHEYNVLRLDLIDKTYPPTQKIFHWTGAKGKDMIRQKMRGL